ncbi:thioredoxin TrxA [Blumeria hordei DH14]|uniref:Thioredoxin TrxA n=1 Tax=Blumeria graminis f. sp. hordei (strain DH14) TaxID=546991 RepID=N1JJ48_BLUG1|nr:thioredoxin TrxA [Blumeria hordei DH14]
MQSPGHMTFHKPQSENPKKTLLLMCGLLNKVSTSTTNSSRVMKMLYCCSHRIGLVPVILLLQSLKSKLKFFQTKLFKVSSRFQQKLIFHRLSDEIKDVHFVSVNGKDSSALCAELYVLAMPAYVAVKNGEKVDQLMGVFPYEMRHSMTNFGYKMIEDKLVKR